MCHDVYFFKLIFKVLATPEPVVLKPIQRKLSLSAAKYTPHSKVGKEKEVVCFV